MSTQVKPHLYIVRGLPGSGKSTFAKQMLSDGKVSQHIEADEFMTDDDGNYKFNPELLKKCHEQCQMWTKYYLDQGEDVVVSNTFTRIWEMQAYFEMGYPYTVIEMKGKFKNIHNVSDKQVKAMADRWQVLKDKKYAK